MLNLRDDDNDGVSDPVCVNVGGELYTTTLDTLTRCRDSMLGAMFTGQIPLLRDSHGNFFIDRDGKTFRHILNFLRCSSLDLPADFTELTLLRREADFFQIRPLMEELERRRAEPGNRSGGGGALLCVEVDSAERVLHFNYKRKPENYELRSCAVRVHSAHIFCTSHTLIELLSSSFSYWTGSVSVVPQAGWMDLKLEWVPCPPELPREQHIKHGFQELSATYQADYSVSNHSNSGVSTHASGSISIFDTRDFMAELLRVVLAEGFRIDLVSPDPSDVLHCHRLRCVRY
ncbi:BTB/POZ domain-containing protein KCTD21-like [Salminus brasiliensis]|uniref:BTB/POZ domain-containing protein KCTD21-like n=1 Tax=Salminus brasiliensis TaxID=930266 RepID=UPI003B831109